MSSGSTSAATCAPSTRSSAASSGSAEGDAFNTALLRRSQQRLRRPRLLREGRREHRAGQRPDKVVIKTKVVERSTGELSFGAGFSTRTASLGDIRLTRAQSARAAARTCAPTSPSRSAASRSTSASPSPTSSIAISPPASTCSDPVPTFSANAPTTRPAQAARCGRLSPDRELAPFGALHLARGRDPERRQRRVDLYQGRGGRAGDLAGRADASPTIAATSIPAIGGLLHPLRPGSGRPGRRQSLHPPRAPS